jgi:hypothetical protein
VGNFSVSPSGLIKIILPWAVIGRQQKDSARVRRRWSGAQSVGTRQLVCASSPAAKPDRSGYKQPPYRSAGRTTHFGNRHIAPGLPGGYVPKWAHIPRSQTRFGNAIRETPFRASLKAVASRRETEFREIGSQNLFGNQRNCSRLTGELQKKENLLAISFVPCLCL